MNKLMILVKGEIIRLLKYKVLMISIFVSLIWAAILFFSSKEEITTMMPLLLMVDATMMTVMYLGASFYLEKQEGSIKSLLVAPVDLKLIIATKVIGAFIMSLMSGVVLGAVAFFVHGVQVNFLLLILYLAVIVFAHTAIGFLLFLNAKDFSQMLGVYIFYALLTTIPTILYMLGMVPAKFKLLMLISPSYASQILIESVLMKVDLLDIIIALVYLLGLGVLLYATYIFKNFRKYMVKE